MSDESTQSPSERDQGGWPATDAGRHTAPDNTPTTAWTANSWNEAVSGPPAPTSGQQWDTPPAYYEQPPARGAWSATPTSPTSVPPQPAPAWSAEPQSGAGWGAPQQPLFPGETTSQYQRRIEPTSPKRRGPVLPLIAGIVAGAIVFGVGGYFLGAATSEDASPGPGSSPSATGQPLFEATQTSINKAKLDGDLAGLAEPWLASTMGSCVSDVDKGAPPLGENESRHVTCRYGSAWVHFAAEKGPEQMNAARIFRQQLNLNSDEIAPGVHDPSRTTGGVTGAPGRLIEYAYRQSDGSAMCGIWWERDADTLAVMLIEAHCQEELGGKWEPLRDLWQRHS